MKSLILCALYCGALSALPSGGQILRGEAEFSSSGDSLQVQANGKAIFHWDGFDVAPHETVRFIQSEKNGAILNRVLSGSSSEILGSLQANCPIYLLNPNGVFVGRNAKLDTAGFFASTADLSNDCFWGEEALFFQKIGGGSIVNLGRISASSGDVCLVARSIENQGEIQAAKGLALLATCEVMLNPETKQTLFIRCESEAGIQNSGTIAALAVELQTHSPYEKAISNQGGIEAFTTANRSGRIYLVADQGECVIDAPLLAEGGAIAVAAKRVRFSEKANLDVSSESGLGSIRIEEAESIHADRGAHFLANALVKGDGGAIVLAAEEALSFYGKVESCGGPLGGNGGTIHLSSSILQCNPIVKASAPQGKTGVFLLDPKFVTIDPTGFDPATDNTFASNPSTTATISGSSLQMALDAANVVIQANTDIVFEDEVTASTAGNSLTLQAGRSIRINGNLTLNAGDFDATINDSGALVSDRDTGAATFELGSGASILTQGGNIALNVGTFGGTQEGELVLNGILDGGGGNLSLEGIARQDGTDNAYGIYTGFSALLQTIGTGTISLSGTGGTGATNNAGINLSGGVLQTDDGLIHLTGVGGGNGMGNGSVGIYSTATLAGLGSGSILLDGTAGSGVHGNMGIYLSQGQIATVDGNITLLGTGAGTGALNFGIRLESGALCASSGSGAIALTGISGNGKNNNHGVILAEGALSANTGSISIAGTGRGSINYNYGIRFEGNSRCSSIGTAPITLSGQNTGGVIGNAGVSFSTSGSALISAYGDIEVTGSSAGTGLLNQGVRLEAGQIVSTGTGAGSANIHLTGVGSAGTDFCNGISIQGYGEITPALYGTVITSVDGNIVLEGTAQGSGQGNQPLDIDPSSLIETTGSGTITYIEH